MIFGKKRDLSRCVSRERFSLRERGFQGGPKKGISGDAMFEMQAWKSARVVMSEADAIYPNSDRSMLVSSGLT